MVSQELVVSFVQMELVRVLVIGEEGIMSVTHVSQASIHVIDREDWGLVSIGLEEEISQVEDLNLFKYFISHGKLFAGSANVSVVVHDPKRGEPGYLDL